jgi:hypothetical protein
MTLNEQLTRLQSIGEEIGFETFKAMNATLLFIGRSFKLVFGGIGVFVLGFVLGLFRRQ